MNFKFKYLIVFLLSGLIASCQDSTPTESIIETEVESPITEVSSIIDTSKFTYFWKEDFDYNYSLVNLFTPPSGYVRQEYSKNTFASWLRHLPIKEDNTVYLFNGEKKYNQTAQYKVLDIDVGDRDLQQCADAVMRLRAEYLYSVGLQKEIHFNYTNGTNIPFSKWSSGLYPSLKGNKVVWTTSSKNNNSYQSFKKYIANIFMYAGTASLEKEMNSISIKDIEPGDVFIKGGFPGHAVIVIDVVVNADTDNKCFLLAQSYMPAQNIHILKNPSNLDLSPWYSVSECGNIIETPEWTFDSNQLKRFTK